MKRFLRLAQTVCIHTRSPHTSLLTDWSTPLSNMIDLVTRKQDLFSLFGRR